MDQTLNPLKGSLTGKLRIPICTRWGALHMNLINPVRVHLVFIAEGPERIFKVDPFNRVPINYPLVV